MLAGCFKAADPIIFGLCVKGYVEGVFAKYADTFAKLRLDANNGSCGVYSKSASWPVGIIATGGMRGSVSLVDSHHGITHLHVLCDTIIGVSMPMAIRGGCKMWNVDDKLQGLLAAFQSAATRASPTRSRSSAARAVPSRRPWALGPVSGLWRRRRKVKHRDFSMFALR